MYRFIIFTIFVKLKNITMALRMKYKAITKTTYDTHQGGLEFDIEINGVGAKGFWTPTGQYCPNGVDIDELILNSGKRISIFQNGGTRRKYEMNGCPVKKDKQPKNLSFTGEYYSTLNLGTTFKNKIKEVLTQENKATLTDEFINVFNLV